MKENTVLIISGKVVLKNSKIDWPDLNFPGSGQTILRTVHDIDYDVLKVQLDHADGPWFSYNTLPQGAGFYKRVQ